MNIVNCLATVPAGCTCGETLGNHCGSRTATVNVAGIPVLRGSACYPNYIYTCTGKYQPANRNKECVPCVEEEGVLGRDICSNAFNGKPQSP